VVSPFNLFGAAKSDQKNDAPPGENVAVLGSDQRILTALPPLMLGKAPPKDGDDPKEASGMSQAIPFTPSW
jgi:hypothetical protein